jgi:hypothetical protein
VASPPEASLEQIVKAELRGPVQDLVRRLTAELVHEVLHGLRKPSRTAWRRNGYRLRGGLFAELAEERRQLIASAPTTLEERDGRRFVVRHLAPSAPMPSQ